MQNIPRIQSLVEQLCQAYIGNRRNVSLIVMALLSDGHILIEDVPGTGKTTLALALAKSIGGDFRRISCTPDIMPSDILGFSMYNPKTGNFDYKTGPIVSHVFLADEINRMPPKSQAGLLEAMQERQITIDDKRIPLPAPFIVIATQNPIEYLGTYALPEAQLDRFMVKVTLGYPSVEEEIRIVSSYHAQSPIDALSPILSSEDIVKLQREVQDVVIKDNIMHYIVSLVRESRTHHSVDLGLSTRATLSVAKMAKAHAYFEGRDFVTPDDVKAIFIPTTAHRIVLTRDAVAKGETASDIMDNILKRIAIRG